MSLQTTVMTHIAQSNNCHKVVHVLVIIKKTAGGGPKYRPHDNANNSYQHGKTCGDIISQLFSSFTDRQTINTNKEFIFEDMSNCNVPHGVNPEIRLFYFQQTTTSFLLQWCSNEEENYGTKFGVPSGGPEFYIRDIMTRV